jgi:hypothetical protein
MSNKKFWIVVSENRGPSDWPCRHNTADSAFNEASRLARYHGGKFFVFECIGASAKVDIVTHKFSDNADEEIPF